MAQRLYLGKNKVVPAIKVGGISDPDSIHYSINNGRISIVPEGNERWLDLSGITTIDNPYLFENMFYLASLMNTTFNAPDLERVTSDYTFRNFARRSNLTSINMNNLSIISGTDTFNLAFSDTSIEGHIDLSSVTSITGNNAASAMFFNTQITSVDLSRLTQISFGKSMSSQTLDTQTCSQMFSDCEQLEEVEISSLEEINGVRGAESMFAYTALTEVHFDSLRYVEHYGLWKTFMGCQNLRHIYFPSITFDSFPTHYTDMNYMSAMCSGCTDVTVHFRPSARTAVVELQGYDTVFGANSGSVAFDIAASVTFNVIPEEMFDSTSVYVNNQAIDIHQPFYTESSQLDTMVYAPRYCLKNYTIELEDFESKTFDIELSDTDGTLLTIDTLGVPATFQYTVNGINLGTHDENTFRAEPGVTVTVVVRAEGYVEDTLTYMFGEEDDTITVSLRPAETIFSLVSPYETEEELETIQNYITINDQFELFDNVIMSGNASWHQKNAKSIVSVPLPAVEEGAEVRVTVTASTDSEYNYDFGAVVISPAESWDPSAANIKNNVLPAEGGTYAFKMSGQAQPMTTSSGTFVSDGRPLYLWLIYAKDSSGDSGEDRFYIQDITVTK